jgi:hypothetical protein
MLVSHKLLQHAACVACSISLGWVDGSKLSCCFSFPLPLPVFIAAKHRLHSTAAIATKKWQKTISRSFLVGTVLIQGLLREDGSSVSVQGRN